ncbi:MAG: recombinase family protein [Lachnospiraceae bacterium]|nr:recombinase family protein [Lachnospiraceae bacterium]
MRYGYIRVSSRDQNPDRQIDAILEAGVDAKCIFIDRQSGKDFDRKQYKELLSLLKAKDVLVIKSIDRLGRNYGDVLEQWRIITKERGIDIEVIDMPLLSTGSDRDLTGTLIADIVLQLLSYVAQTEREFIRQRQAEGIEAAKKRGVRFGRKPMVKPENFEQVKELWYKGELSARGAARILQVSHSTFLRWVTPKEV